MNMDRSTAEQWVTISAVVVIGVYAYRRLTEAASGPANLKKIVGLGNPVPLGAFVTAWGFTYLVVALMTEISPSFGGSFAALIATSDLLTNAPAITADLGKNTKGTINAKATTSSTQAQGGTQVVTGLTNPNHSQGGAQIVGGTVTQGAGNVGAGTLHVLGL